MNKNKKFLIDTSLLDQMIKDGFVMVQKHPTEKLYIYNYTNLCQYESMWNDVTLKCRGLILDENYNLVAKGFNKFFNLGKHESSKLADIPKEYFEVYEKLDGSIGILYFIDDKPYIASRGSFNSEQALHATDLLYSKYSHVIDKLNRNYSYLFEIIYPSNRIIVDYGNLDDIILIGIIDNFSGEEVDLVDIGFPVVKKYNGVKYIDELLLNQEKNREGYVLKFKNGLRVKIKYDEYVRLHRLITQVSSISIWESLRYNNSFDEILDRVPDEFYSWVKKTQTDLLLQYYKIETEALEVLQLKNKFSRKDFSNYCDENTSKRIKSIVFLMYDNKDYSDYIWKTIRPKFQKPFENKDI